MTALIPTRPVIGRCLPFVTADSIVAHLAGDAGGDLPLSNILSQLIMLHGRTLTAADPGGFEVRLAAEVQAFAFEVANTEANTGEDIRWLVDNVTPFVAATTLDSGSPWPQRREDVWTSGGKQIQVPQRSAVLLGFDDFSGGVGPTPAAVPDVATRACRSVRIEFSSAAGSRTFWEASFLGIGIDGRRLPAVEFPGDAPSMPVETVELREGTGHMWTVSWAHMPTDDADHVDFLWDTSGYGTRPIFFFPVAGQRNTSGLITDANQRPALRGGLARMLEWSRTESRPTVVGGVETREVSATLVCETWQEVRSGGS